MTKTKWLWLILIFVILITALILQKEISQTLNLDTKPQTKSLVDDKIYQIAVDKTDDIFGNPGAGITIVEYLNFGTCNSRCQNLHQELYDFVKANPARVRLVFKHTGAASLFSSSNKLAHIATYCMSGQAKFWDFVNALVKDSKRNEKSLSKIIADLSVNPTKINDCINDQKTIDAINSKFAEAGLLDIKDNPAIFINNKKINVYEDVNLTELLTKISADTTN